MRGDGISRVNYRKDYRRNYRKGYRRKFCAEYIVWSSTQHLEVDLQKSSDKHFGSCCGNKSDM